ncbi:GNAT family N-acetyltransferase [Streptomyces anulatus]
MPLIRDLVQADYSVVEELLYSNYLGDGRFYDPEGLDVVVAERRGSVVGVAEFQLHCDFGHDEGREAHPGEQTFVLTMAVAHAARRGGAGRALLAEIAAGPRKPATRSWHWYRRTATMRLTGRRSFRRAGSRSTAPPDRAGHGGARSRRFSP